MKNKRVAYLDYLRIVACYLVVLVHVSAQFVVMYRMDTTSYAVSLAYDFLGLIGVPIFVMISGALTLRSGYNVTLKSVITEKTLHYFIIYYIWKALYQLYTMYVNHTPMTAYNIKNDVLLALIQKSGYYHLWYLPMLAIIFMIYPIIKKSLENNKTICVYFVTVFFVVEVLFPTLFNYEFKFKYLFVDFFNQNSFYMFGGYLGYFVLGHYLNGWCKNVGKFKLALIALAGIIATIAAAYLGVVASIVKGEPSYIMNTPFSVPSFIVAVAIFLVIENVFSAKGGYSGNLLKVANTTLGVYLLHPLVLELLPQDVFNYGKMYPAIAIPVITLIVAIICCVITRLMLYVPIIKRLVS